MTWRVKIEADPMRGGDRVMVGRPSGPDYAEAVVYDRGMPGLGLIERYPMSQLPPDHSVLCLPDGVLDAIVAERRDPGPSDELVAELRSALAVERERVDTILYTPPPTGAGGPGLRDMVEDIGPLAVIEGVLSICSTANGDAFADAILRTIASHHLPDRETAILRHAAQTAAESAAASSGPYFDRDQGDAG